MSSDEAEFADIFQLPEHYYQEEKKAQSQEYLLKTPINGRTSIVLNLVANHPLWGHLLTNTAKVMAQYIQDNIQFGKGSGHVRNVCEVGAGAALPSIISALKGANFTLITDYPDVELLQNIETNVHLNFPSLDDEPRIAVKGFCWGKSTTEFSKMLPQGENFDLLILCDVIFNHSEHRQLLKSAKELLTNNNNSQKNSRGQVLVFFTHHRPTKIEQDLAFFEIAKTEFDFKVTELLNLYTGPLFLDEVGDINVRGTVHGYRMTL